MQEVVTNDFQPFRPKIEMQPYYREMIIDLPLKMSTLNQALEKPGMVRFQLFLRPEQFFWTRTVT